MTHRVSVDTLIFDLDGTLIDSGADIVNAVNFALVKLGFPERPFGEIISYVGMGVKDLIRKTFAGHDGDLLGKALDLFVGFYREHPADEATLYPHVADMLLFFRKKTKFIITNSTKELADAKINALGIGKYFDRVFAGDDDTCLKPSACLVERAVSDLKNKKKKVMIVGDMDIDVLTGKNAGILTCAVTYGIGRTEDIEKTNPDFMINDIAELKEIVE